MLVNDFVLRGWAPGWLTGKLSDVGWLVVAPVLLASVLSWLRCPDRVATRLALVAVAGFYITLQLWPPLGAHFQVGHVADLGDLVVLPALGLATLCWRARRRRGAWAIPVLAATMLADEYDSPPDATAPCASAPTWAPGEPLRLSLSVWWPIPYTSEAFLAGLDLRDEQGNAVPLVVAADPDGMYALLVCARDGLRGNAAYTWKAGPWHADESNQLSFEQPGLPEISFVTEPGSGVPVTTAAECAALATQARAEQMSACWRNDPRDSGDTADSGDSE
ncbi:MAG: hypothetical protein FJ102_10035 [Deltaproteobacteria bacterium]|nr:hypothetical protein [Deltaproteobacteria bacterium]